MAVPVTAAFALPDPADDVAAASAAADVLEEAAAAVEVVDGAAAVSELEGTAAPVPVSVGFTGDGERMRVTVDSAESEAEEGAEEEGLT